VVNRLGGTVSAHTAGTGHFQDDNLAMGTAQRKAAMTFKDGRARLILPLETPTNLISMLREMSQGAHDIARDMSRFYLKAKKFHWRVSGPHFRD
jgi:hypothetical protein